SVPDRRHTRHMSARVASLQRITVPEIIPIDYEPDYHTGRIGQWEGSHFLGSGITPLREHSTHAVDWPSHQRWYAVLHTFDAAGHHLNSRIEHTGAEDRPTSDVLAEERLKHWLDDLPGLVASSERCKKLDEVGAVGGS